MANVAEIPVIDIDAEGEREVQVAKELVEAAITHGFIYIRNTGQDIPAEAIEEAFQLSKKLFNAPLEEKQQCSIQKNNLGWSGMQVETLDPKNQRVGDYKEAFNFGEFTATGAAQQPVPPTIAPDTPRLAAFRELCYRLCLRLNALLGVGLAVDPPDFFARAHLRERGASDMVLRLLYYPPAARTDADVRADVRAGAHSDYGSITLLFRLPGQAGLEILQSPGDGDSEGAWAPVPVVPPGTDDDEAPPILVNVGDLLSYWTNGLLRSTVHRVVFSGGAGEEADDPRYSIAFFCHPVGTTPLTAVPSERVRNFRPSGSSSSADSSNPYAERKVLTANEHLRSRLEASYLQLYAKEKKTGEVA